MEAVNLDAFERSAAALRRALTLYREYQSEKLAVTLRNSLILEFEICFGQLKAPLQRCLIRLDALSPAEVNTMSYPELMRTANVHGYSDVEWERWKAFREARNETAHAYSQAKAEEIAAIIPEFLSAVEQTLHVMHRKQATS